MTKSIRIRIMHSALKQHETIVLPISDDASRDIALDAIGSGPLRLRATGQTTGIVSLSPRRIKDRIASKEARDLVSLIEDEDLQAGLRRLGAVYAKHWADEGFIALASLSGE